MLKDRLASFAKETRDKANLLPLGSERDEMLAKARQAGTASHIDDWVNSPGLQPPKWTFFPAVISAWKARRLAADQFPCATCTTIRQMRSASKMRLRSSMADTTCGFSVAVLTGDRSILGYGETWPMGSALRGIKAAAMQQKASWR
jgi:hypothetical protein